MILTSFYYKCSITYVVNTTLVVLRRQSNITYVIKLVKGGNSPLAFWAVKGYESDIDHEKNCKRNKFFVA